MASTNKILGTLLELKETSWRYKIASNPLYISTLITLIIIFLISVLYSNGLFQLTFYIFFAVLLVLFIHNNVIINEVKREKISDKIMELFSTPRNMSNPNESRPMIYPGSENIILGGGGESGDTAGGYIGGGGIGGMAIPHHHISGDDTGIHGLSDEYV